MTAPRVWVGVDYTQCPSYWTHEGPSHWENYDYYSIRLGRIFIPATGDEESKPTIDVGDLDTLKTCKVVDW